MEISGSRLTCCLLIRDQHSLKGSEDLPSPNLLITASAVRLMSVSFPALGFRDPAEFALATLAVSRASADGEN
jgi:hypothetical protein